MLRRRTGGEEESTTDGGGSSSSRSHASDRDRGPGKDVPLQSVSVVGGTTTGEGMS